MNIREERGQVKREGVSERARQAGVHTCVRDKKALSSTSGRERRGKREAEKERKQEKEGRGQNERARPA